MLTRNCCLFRRAGLKTYERHSNACVVGPAALRASRAAVGHAEVVYHAAHARHVMDVDHVRHADLPVRILAVDRVVPPHPPARSAAHARHAVLARPAHLVEHVFRVEAAILITVRQPAGHAVLLDPAVQVVAVVRHVVHAGHAHHAGHVAHVGHVDHADLVDLADHAGHVDLVNSHVAVHAGLADAARVVALAAAGLAGPVTITRV